MSYDIHSQSTQTSKRFNNMKENVAGFTLLELMIVVAILGIMAAIASPSYTNMVQRNAVKRTLTELETSFTTARIKAYSSGRPSTICPVKDVTTEPSATKPLKCLNDWSDLADADKPNSGWVVFQDRNQNNEMDSNDVVYKRTAFDSKKAILAWTGATDIIRISARNTTGTVGTMRIGYPTEKFSTWSNEDTAFQTKVHETRLVINMLGNITNKTKI